MPLYLLDSNVLISANRNYYPLDRIPQYWDWIIEKASANQIKIPREIYEEISKASDNLAQWVKQPHVKEVLVLNEETDIGKV